MNIVKERRISSRQQEICFKSSIEQYELVRSTFLSSDLGKIYQSIPWDLLVKEFKLKESRKGRKSIFSPQGKIGLMFLKHYSGCSDKRLIEQLNSNVHYQLFCDLLLSPGDYLPNYKIVSEIRVELANTLSIDKLEQVLCTHWLPYMDNKSFMLVDATCYESHLRYPTNVKLLWESVYWANKQMESLYKQAGIRKPRTKYTKWAKRYSEYARKRRRAKKHTIAISRALLKLLKKVIGALSLIEKDQSLTYPIIYQSYRKTIAKVYTQQLELFTTGKSPKNRIVSLHKPYLRPIVRGKEVKSVEFGAKVNKIQIDGINFIEHLSFDAFNEGTRLTSSIYKAQLLTKIKTSLIGADAIYATNNNRRFCTSNEIHTDFVRKGKAGKNEDQRLILAKQIKKERASRLEGSFGNEKEHYHLKKIKARTKKTEILWIFFGVHTANALEIGRRMTEKTELKLTG